MRLIVINIARVINWWHQVSFLLTFTVNFPPNLILGLWFSISLKVGLDASVRSVFQKLTRGSSLFSFYASVLACYCGQIKFLAQWWSACFNVLKRDKCVNYQPNLVKCWTFLYIASLPTFLFQILVKEFITWKSSRIIPAEEISCSKFRWLNCNNVNSNTFYHLFILILCSSYLWYKDVTWRHAVICGGVFRTLSNS